MANVPKWVVGIAVVVVILVALWFKGGEFFCRLRGGGWDPHFELCHTG